MGENRLDAAALDGVLAAVLHQHPDAALVALAENGVMIPWPGDDRFAGHLLVPVPAAPATMMGLVVPVDRMIVVAAWERAHLVGTARRVVRMRNDPDRTIALTFVDARARHGVWLGLLVAMGGAQSGQNVGDVVVTLDSLRPRTATVTKNFYGIIIAIDDRATRMLGWSPAEMIGQRSLNFLHPDDHERAIANWGELNPDQPIRRVRVRHGTKDQGWLWVEVEHTYHGADDPDAITVMAQLSDISEEMAAHEAIDQREKLFRRLAESLPIGMFQILTDRRVVYANDRLGRILGTGSATVLEQQLATVIAPDRPALDAAFTAVLEGGGNQHVEVGIRLTDPGRRPGAVHRRVAMTLAALSDQEGGPGAIVTVSDVTEADRMRQELTQRATIDALTGCHNRGSTLAVLERALMLDHRPIAVVFIDLDKFKSVNDELGHSVGDDLLVYAAGRLLELVRADDVVGRIGGDEFLLICRGVHSVEAARTLAGRVATALHADIAVTGGQVALRASIGVALSKPGVVAEALVAMADIAMYESKRHGDGDPVFYAEG